MLPSRFFLMRHWLEYLPVWLLAKYVGLLPRPLARGFGVTVGLLVYLLHPRLRQVGLRTLDIAFPAKSRKQKKKIVREVYRNLGRQLAEVYLLPRYKKVNVSGVAVYVGVEKLADG